MSYPFEWQTIRRAPPSAANGTLLQLRALLACNKRQLRLIMILAQRVRKAKMIGVDPNTGESVYEIGLDYAREVLIRNRYPHEY